MNDVIALSADSLRWRYEFLQAAHAAQVADLRAQLLDVLPELRDAPAAVAAAIELVTSFEAWSRLRHEQRLGKERATAAMEQAALSLLAGGA